MRICISDTQQDHQTQERSPLHTVSEMSLQQTPFLHCLCLFAQTCVVKPVQFLDKTLAFRNREALGLTEVKKGFKKTLE